MIWIGKFLRYLQLKSGIFFCGYLAVHWHTTVSIHLPYKGFGVVTCLVLVLP